MTSDDYCPDADLSREAIATLGVSIALSLWFESRLGSKNPPPGLMFIMGMQIGVHHPDWTRRAVEKIEADISTDGLATIITRMEELTQIFTFD